MRYYPISLDIKNRDCLVVGGGSVGSRKVATLLDCGARVTVVSPQFSEPLRRLAAKHAVRLIERPYESSDLQDMFLVIGATDDQQLNQRVSADASEHDMLCNIADRPAAGNFILPAIVNRGDLTITVSTSGKSPAMAKRIRQHLSKQFGSEYGQCLVLMGKIRKALLSQAHAPEAHKTLFEQLIDAGILDMLREQQIAAVDNLLQDVLGERFTYSRLMSPEGFTHN